MGQAKIAGWVFTLAHTVAKVGCRSRAVGGHTFRWDPLERGSPHSLCFPFVTEAVVGIFEVHWWGGRENEG